ncbi:sulfite exporter TauE/SafE family protein [Aliiroseovarius sp. KMU-50]|uniref:Probable membrane transporter protein n=1 Tax=Aliiroseovarius salicola TaxID=3009082 RepID=A0ABT4VY54_9RHOB|nr:sulfite exporter TauE/SafE family protein [Aliiroseovarius sp. KMU-50]MDA5093203.1 sulfite exporter TauE/SafE family protein [Aliiroseovarius sp. KMU-50]
MGIVADLPIWMLFLAVGVALSAGFVKGAVGFGLPLIMISGLAITLPAEIALAALILPTVVTNLWQSLRQGLRAAMEAVGKYKLFLTSFLVVIMLSAQLVRVLPQNVLFIAIGVPIVLLCLVQLRGWSPNLKPENRPRDESVVGAIAGFIGGISGVWGPPTVAYLTAVNTPKAEQMRVQGVIYGVGAVALVAAHLKSGVFNSQTAPLSALLLFPAVIGMMIGGRFHDAMPQATFKRVTLVILTVLGLNLIRKGLMG